MSPLLLQICWDKIWGRKTYPTIFIVSKGSEVSACIAWRKKGSLVYNIYQTPGPGKASNMALSGPAWLTQDIISWPGSQDFTTWRLYCGEEGCYQAEQIERNTKLQPQPGEGAGDHCPPDQDHVLQHGGQG